MLKVRMKSLFPLLLSLSLILAACAPAATATNAPAVPTTPPVVQPTTGEAQPTSPPVATTAPQTSGQPTVVNFYTDSDTNISDWMQNVVAPAFQQKFPQYQLKVTIVRGIGNGVQDIADRAYAAMQTNSDPQVDVIEFDSMSKPDLIQKGLWETLDTSNVPNSSKLLKGVKTSDTSMPYRGSQVLLAYDSTKLPENQVPRTFPDLITWIKAHPGEFVYCRPDKGGSGGNFVIRAIYQVTGNDPSLFKPGTPDQALLDQFPKAWDLLRSIHTDIYDNGAYPAGNNPVLELLANGSVTMAPVWSDQALQALQKGVLPDTIKLSQLTDLPFPGGNAFLSVPKNSRNLQGALDFVNFMLTSDEQVSVVKTIGGFPAVDWSNLPSDLQQQYTSVIASSVPVWPGGVWTQERDKGWYNNVATNIKQGS